MLSLMSRQLARFFGFGLTPPQHGAQSTGPESYGGTVSGVTVSDERSLSVAAVFACVRLLVEVVAVMPLIIYKETAGGADRREYRESTLFQLFYSSPNRVQTPVEFLETMMLHLVLRGNAYAVIERNVAGDVISLTPLPADAVDVVVLEDGTPTYAYATDRGVTVYAQSNVFHVRLFGPGRYVGLSPLGYARQTIGLSLAATDGQSRFFANGSRPSGVLMLDKVLTKEQREQVRERFASMYEGGENAFKMFVLEAGMTYQQLGISPADSQLLQTTAASAEDVCRFFRVPPFLVGFTEKVTSWGSGLEQQNRAFLLYCLQTYLTRWQEAINTRLVPIDERLDVYAEFDTQALLQGDSAGLAAFLSTMTQNGMMTRNEGRKRINLPAKAGGDELTVQVNLTPLELLGRQPITAVGVGVGGADGNQTVAVS